MEFTVRPETAADEAAIREIETLAFGRPLEAGMVDKVRQSPGFVPVLSLVAERDEKIVGHVLFSKVTIEDAGEAVEVLALGPIGVSPEWQKQGAGGQMIRAGLERARELGYRAVILVGHPTYYPRFGFSPASRFGLKTTFTVPDGVFMALPLYPNGLEGVRGTVIYPSAFDEG